MLKGNCKSDKIPLFPKVTGQAIPPRNPLNSLESRIAVMAAPAATVAVSPFTLSATVGTPLTHAQSHVTQVSKNLSSLQSMRTWDYLRIVVVAAVAAAAAVVKVAFSALSAAPAHSFTPSRSPCITAWPSPPPRQPSPPRASRPPRAALAPVPAAAKSHPRPRRVRRPGSARCTMFARKRRRAVRAGCRPQVSHHGETAPPGKSIVSDRQGASAPT